MCLDVYNVLGVNSHMLLVFDAVAVLSKVPSKDRFLQLGR